MKVTFEGKTATAVSFTVMGKSQSKEDVKTRSMVYIDEILENADKGDTATKIKRTYEKAVVGKDGQDDKMPIEGRTVLIEKKGDKYTFTVDGAALTGESLNLLNVDFNKPDGKLSQDFFLPKKPVKPGETWKIDAAGIIKSLSASGFAMDESKTTATSTLKKAYK